jgi:6-phosphogluconolactonase
MKDNIRIYDSPLTLAKALVLDLKSSLEQCVLHNSHFYLALSGGSTPKLFFEQLAYESSQDDWPWQYLHIFWSDERCVPPEHPESNYGMTRRMLFDIIPIPPINIHRIRGEASLFEEALRYEDEIKNTIQEQNSGVPIFDWIMLGLGEDGHTASLFPDSVVLAEKSHICMVSENPRTGQKRITMTLPLINKARRVSFLAIGESKMYIAKNIITSHEDNRLFPATLIRPVAGILEWFLDERAARLL